MQRALFCLTYRINNLDVEQTISLVYTTGRIKEKILFLVIFLQIKLSKNKD